MSNTGYIDLKINGRLFPSWVLMNFKKYKLPEIIREKGQDPCSIKTKEEVRVYQDFLANYLSYKSPFKDILIYHGLGSGKTVSAINIYNVLFNYTPNWNVYILIKASLRDDPWMKDLRKWLSDDEKSLRFEKNVMKATARITPGIAYPETEKFVKYIKILLFEIRLP